MLKKQLLYEAFEEYFDEKVPIQLNRDRDKIALFVILLFV